MDLTAEDIEQESQLKTFDIFKDLSKPVRLSLHLIVKRNLPIEAERWSQDEIVCALNKITHLRLDRENINEIDSLELLGQKVINVYLQQNSIKKIENLECLKSLKFLSLANNCIQRVENLLELNHLRVLDLTNNQIEVLDTDELPKSLIILNLEHNPCTEISGYCHHRETVISCLPNLLQLDSEDVKRPGDEEDDVDDDGIIEDDEEESLPSVNGGYADVRLLAGAMLMRSQDRLESSQEKHSRHLSELYRLRLQHNIVKR